DAPPLRRGMAGGVLDHLGRKAETRRDAEGVGRAGASERDAVERLLRLEVEASGAVGGVGRRARRLLQLVVVARRDREACLAGEPLEEGAGERSSLDRVGSRGELVEENERP